MAPHQIPHASVANAAAPPLLAVVGNNNHPAVAQPTAQLRYCLVCGRGFRSRFGLSGHYNAHSNRQHKTKVKRLPENSTVRKQILKAKFEALDYQYKEEGRARARALASGSGITNETEHLQVSVTSGRAAAAPGPQFPKEGPEMSLRVVAAAPMAQSQGPVVKNLDFGASSAGSSNVGRRPLLQETGPKAKAQEEGGGGSSSDPRSPNYWKLTGPVVRVQGPGGLLIYKPDLGTASGSGKGGGD